MNIYRHKTYPILFLAALIVLAVACTTTISDPTVNASGARPVPAPQGWRLEPPVTYQNLSVFPVVTSQDTDTSGFVTLDDALASGDVTVAEQGEYLRRTRDGVPRPVYQSGAQVNQLVLVNRGKRPLLLLAGEVVSGGKQDRVIGKDRIVPVGAPPLPLDVFCVENGRWTGESVNFSAGKVMVHPSVREEVAVAQDQSKVWAAVRGDTSAKVGSSAETVVIAPPALPQASVSGVIASEAPTQSYKRIYESRAVGVSADSFAREIEERFDRATAHLKGERVGGVVVAYGDEVAWSDVFASSALFEAYWPKLLRSYVIEALTRPAVRQTVSLDDAHDFLRPLSGHIEQESEPGVYEWRKQSLGHLSEIQLAALAPKPLTLHWLRVLRAS
jgi:ARG/rhodanese/phosphatase superfamily protein